MAAGGALARFLRAAAAARGGGDVRDNQTSHNKDTLCTRRSRDCSRQHEEKQGPHAADMPRHGEFASSIFRPSALVNCRFIDRRLYADTIGSWESCSSR
ncbi:hypothetical protein BKA81DRAFT_343238 [Phyllosticta paracitricarpa]